MSGKEPEIKDKEEATSVPPSTTQYSGSQVQDGKKNSVVVKVGMVGDSQIGKTSLMVKYVEGTFDEDYIQTLGMKFLTINMSLFLFLFD